MSASDAAGRRYAAGIAARYSNTDAICLPQLAWAGDELCDRICIHSAMYPSPGRMLTAAYSAVVNDVSPLMPIQSVANGNSDRQNRKPRLAHRIPWLTVSTSSTK